MDSQQLIRKAQTSGFHRKLLNTSLSRIIPFNKPHRISIIELDETRVKTKLPYVRKNLNHIKGLHACGLATLAEFTTGINLLRQLDTKKYRIIMKEITMSYHYQGKCDAVAEFVVDEPWLNENVYSPLEVDDKVDVQLQIKVMDVENNHLATGNITWQIKDWEKVKTTL